MNAAEFGSAWPLTVPSGTLACTPSVNGDGREYVTFTTEAGVEYAINGEARGMGRYKEPDAGFVKDFPNLSGLAPLIQRGLALC